VLRDALQALPLQIRDGVENASRNDVALDLAKPQLALIAEGHNTGRKG